MDAPQFFHCYHSDENLFHISNTKIHVFSLCPHMVEGARELPRVPFVSPLIPLMRAIPSWANHLSKALPLNTITFRVRISTYEFWGGTDIQSIAEGLIYYLCFAITIVQIAQLQRSCGEAGKPQGELGISYCVLNIRMIWIKTKFVLGLRVDSDICDRMIEWTVV